MGKSYNVFEATKLLDKHYVTDSIKMVTRWIRNGELVGSRSNNRKEGYLIDEEDLLEFIEERNPGIVQYIHYFERSLEHKMSIEDKPTVNVQQTTSAIYREEPVFKSEVTDTQEEHEIAMTSLPLSWEGKFQELEKTLTTAVVGEIQQINERLTILEKQNKEKNLHNESIKPIKAPTQPHEALDSSKELETPLSNENITDKKPVTQQINNTSSEKTYRELSENTSEQEFVDFCSNIRQVKAKPHEMDKEIFLLLYRYFFKDKNVRKDKRVGDKFIFLSHSGEIKYLLKLAIQKCRSNKKIRDEVHRGIEVSDEQMLMKDNPSSVLTIKVDEGN